MQKFVPTITMQAQWEMMILPWRPYIWCTSDHILRRQWPTTKFVSITIYVIWLCASVGQILLEKMLVIICFEWYHHCSVPCWMLSLTQQSLTLEMQQCSHTSLEWGYCNFVCPFIKYRPGSFFQAPVAGRLLLIDSFMYNFDIYFESLRSWGSLLFAPDEVHRLTTSSTFIYLNFARQ